MAKNKKIGVLNTEISLQSNQKEDYISLTDIARYKNLNRSDDLIHNWLRNRNTIEFLGIWESLNNPGFNSVEFDGFRIQAGLLNMALFGKTVKQWRDENPDEKGNIRDYANVSQLVCLSNLENLNAHFIQECLSQSERLTEIGKGGKRGVPSYVLSRYARYLVVRDGDLSKPVIANGQTYSRVLEVRR